MYTLHVFPSSEDNYGCVTGADSNYNHTFPSEEAAMLWFKEEFSDSGWSYLSDEMLQEERAEFRRQNLNDVSVSATKS